MGVVMDREAARTVKPFPTLRTDVFPGLSLVVTIIRVDGTKRFRRRSSVSEIQFLWEVGERDAGCGVWMLVRVSARVHPVENEMRNDGTGGQFRVITAWFDEIFARVSKG